MITYQSYWKPSANTGDTGTFRNTVSFPVQVRLHNCIMSRLQRSCAVSVHRETYWHKWDVAQSTGCLQLGQTSDVVRTPLCAYGCSGSVQSSQMRSGGVLKRLRTQCPCVSSLSSTDGTGHKHHMPLKVRVDLNWLRNKLYCSPQTLSNSSTCGGFGSVRVGSPAPSTASPLRKALSFRGAQTVPSGDLH